MTDITPDAENQLVAEMPASAMSIPAMATYYGPGFDGHRTASGERFNRRALTAAHRTYPFGTRLAVTNPENGKSVVVRINDRGPFTKGYSLDLSEAAAKTIGRLTSGPVLVSVGR